MQHPEIVHKKPVTRRQFLKMSGMSGAVMLAASYPFFIERYLVQENRYRIPVPNLPTEFTGFRILQLTDLHYGFLVSLRHLESIIARANSIPCDAIVCTGDYVHERNATGQIDAVWPVLADLRAPSGVFSVLGNHDHWADTDRSQFWLTRTGQDLRHKAARLDRNGKGIWFVGAGDLYEDHRNLDTLLGDLPESECRIVLAHNPDSADTEYHGRVDLFISGHTHGGQVDIPFIGPPVLPVRNRTYSSGLKKSPRNTGVFISKGIGWAIYPVRFNCYPEIAILELVPASDNA